MEGFKNSTRMKVISDVAPQAYAKGGAVKGMAKVGKAEAKFPIKRENGGSSALTRAEREAMMEEPSRPLTAAQLRSAKAMVMAKAAAPKREPLLPTRVPSSGEMQRVFGAPRAKASLLDKLSEPTGVYSSDPEERRAAYVKGKTFKNLRNLEADPGYMTAAELRRIERDRPTNASGSSRYKMGGKVGGSKVPY